MYEDKTLVCKECGQEFVFTAGEQEFYAERGFQNEPQRCKACRDARKNAARGPREYFTAVCAACGGEARVPFEPKSDRPVYCSECFAKMRAQQRYTNQSVLVSCRGGARWAPLLLLPWEPAAAPRAGETGGIPEKCAGADAESPHFQAFQRFSLEKHRKLEYNTPAEFQIRIGGTSDDRDQEGHHHR